MADPYLTPAAVRALVPQLPQAPDDEIASSVTRLEEIVEQARGVAYVPREATHTETMRTLPSLWLPHLFVRSITTVTADGEEIVVPAADVNLATGRVRVAGSSVTVDYVHGLTTVPPGVLVRATAEYVWCELSAARSGGSRDVIVQSYEGGVTRYSSPSWEQGRFTGWLEVDRLINSLRDHRRSVLVG